jgi:tetratricopeptide (TPR) repeat protein
MRSTIAIALAIAILSAPATALGQGKPPAAAETAVEHSAKARAAYERGDFREAIDRYEKAYAIEKNPTLLFNLGRCYEALATEADLRVAVEKYDAYLSGSKEAADRAAVERRIEALREQIRLLEAARSRPPAPPPPVAPKEEAPPQRAPMIAPWIIAGVGGAGVTAAIALGVVAKGKNDDAQATSSGQEAMDLEDDAGGFAIASNVAFGVGGAALLAGAIWGIVDLAHVARVDRERSRILRLEVGLGTLGISGEL